MNETTLPHGSWPSPVRAIDLARGVRLDELVAVGDALLFTRSDPDTGAARLHRWREADGVRPLGGLNVRSRVHEYGGGAIVRDGADGAVLAVDFADQRLHRVDAEGRTEPVTAESDRRVRFANGASLPDGRVVLVRETHDGAQATQVRNELVVLDPADGGQHVLVADHDFVAAPRVGPDGWLAWLTWEHPQMPWDAAALWAGRLDGDALVEVRQVAGGEEVAVAEVAWWGPDLLFTEDSTGFWELYHHDLTTGRTRRLTERGIDLGRPRWVFGHDGLTVVGDVAVAIEIDRARAGLLRIDLTRDGLDGPSATVRPFPSTGAVGQPSEVVAFGAGVATREVDQDGAQAIRLRTFDGGSRTVAEVAAPTSRPGDLGAIESITVGTGESATHAFLHHPANADATAPTGQAPPLVVFLHGGPTGHSYPIRGAAIAFWTTRGFAVADVNYRGSTGYGRAYRNAMRGRWGEIEVADVIALATELGRRGVVDADRMAIRGGSAGGFTTLAVLTSPSHPFACGTSFFGVADLAALAADTHKFESRYLDQMVGPLPAAAEVYRERSPLTHVDRLTVPLLVLQGLDDEVVPPAQSQVIVDAARERGLLHDYLVFEGEGHGFRRPENVQTWHEAELAYYRRVMGLDGGD